jgi:hypothetical protein
MVKSCGSTAELPSKLPILSAAEGDRIHGVAVKCVDIMKNTSCEGGLLVRY